MSPTSALPHQTFHSRSPSSSSSSSLTAIVTGGGRGIGKATATLLAKKGVNVVVCSRTKSEIDAAISSMTRIHDRLLGIVCDIRVGSQVDELVKKTVSRFGKIDILVNNAGIVHIRRLVDTTEKEWDDTLATNLKGTFLCCKAVLPYLASDGTIINVSSGAGRVGFENLSAYCASKFGVMGLTESLSWEVSGSIRVLAICPGEVDTQMQNSNNEYYLKSRSQMLTPEQVATKIVEMIFKQGVYKNGQCVDI